MAFDVRLSKRADSDLTAILDYYQEISKTVARKIWEQIVKAVGVLADNPLIGRIVPELRDEGNQKYREMIVDYYRIIYVVSVDSKAVIVMRIVDSRQLLQMDID